MEAKTKMKKLIALILATIMLLALCACGGGNGGVSGNVSYDIPEGKVLPDDAVIDVTLSSHASWPYDENWKVWEYIEEAVGGTINVNAVPASDFQTKYSLTMAAPDTLPDVFGCHNKPGSFADYCEQGAFLALDDYEEFLPDYNKFWDSLPKDEQWMRETRRTADGKIYYAPIYGMERSTNIHAWLYRKDIFDKHGLEAPKTMNELYTVSKKLKELYPDSFPFCMRNGLNNIDIIGASWKPNFRTTSYYDFENEKWCYGAAESEIMLEIVTFFNKMVNEKLVPPDFITINTSSWQELVTTDRGFIMPEYQVRIDFFNNIARANNPEFTMAAMMPPKSENGIGVNMLNKRNIDPMGFCIPNTGDAASIANTMRYVNWFYSDEGCETISWGKEGETYEIVDGKKQFILPNESDSAKLLYGFQTSGTYLRVDPESIDASISEEQASVTDFLLEYTYPNIDPRRYMELTSAESQQIADLNTSVETMVWENITKFMIGQRPLTEWDKFQEELSALPLDEILAVYEGAYNKIK